jgi:sarcosine oxidase
MADDYDVIVIGVGAMGAASCSFLAARGARVLGLEQFEIPHTQGSSHGGGRVIRLCYYEHPDYVPLLHRAFDLWGELERESGETLLQMTGGLYMGPPDSDFITGCFRAAREHDLPHDALDHGAIRDRFPQFAIPADHVGVYEPRAGILFPERIIAAYVRSALAHGARIQGHETVLDWSSDDAGVTVRTDRGTYGARHLVFCAGAWTGPLLSEIGVPLVVSRQVAGWVWPRRPESFAVGRLPIWGIDDPDGYFAYGFPMLPDRPGCKVARHFVGPTVEAATVDRAIGPGDDDDIRHIVRTFVPDAEGPVLSMQVCMYTNTPDAHFIVDRHPDHERVTIAAGFSGHGFKFASVLGEVLADLALDGGTEQPMGFLGMGRF